MSGSTWSKGSWGRAIKAELTINCELVAGILRQFLVEEVLKVGGKGLIVGLSGGVDSALAAWLAVEALGRGSVLAVTMPYRTSSQASRDDAGAVAAALEIECLEEDISPQIDAYFRGHPEADQTRRGNKMARERMSILYDLSRQRSLLVLGTSNKSELLLGYGTLWGDMAHALNPLGDLYKTQLYQLAAFAGLPASVLHKAPTADLFEGQSDEGDLGFSYPEADQILYLLVEERRSEEEVVELGHPEALVQDVWRRVRQSQFKRRPPLIAKLSQRTIHLDFRYPRDWGS